MGDDGLRLLTPHISKCRVQCLTLENCGLTDASLPFITSIMKVRDLYLTERYLCSSLCRLVSGSNARQALLELHFAGISWRGRCGVQVPSSDD